MCDYSPWPVANFPRELKPSANETVRNCIIRPRPRLESTHCHSTHTRTHTPTFHTTLCIYYLRRRDREFQLVLLSPVLSTLSSGIPSPEIRRRVAVSSAERERESLARAYSGKLRQASVVPTVKWKFRVRREAAASSRGAERACRVPGITFASVLIVSQDRIVKLGFPGARGCSLRRSARRIGVVRSGLC